jgi:superfamily II DNA or RNA helicase/HKD family nuclease/diadenosine tetraphosphate (Ap4A) HIT family hydrolase
MAQEPGCPFCHPDVQRLAFVQETVFALWDGFPVSPGHILVIPKRHFPTWFEATSDELQAITKAIEEAKRTVEQKQNPQGYNIGVNVGKAAGQTIAHLHVHLIPRYENDTPNPRGGVRHVIPGKGDYLASPGHASPRLITGGEDDPLLPALAEHLAQADEADIAVGFIQPSGVTRLEEHLRDLLERRKGRLRLVTGDYLGITDPDALMRLLDLEGDHELRVFETQLPPTPEWPGPSRAVSFHPKSYILRNADGTGVAFVGSSNLTESALTSGIEWNYRVVSAQEGTPFADVVKAFERLFHHPATKPLDAAWVDAYRRRRAVRPLEHLAAATQDVEVEVVTPPEPHEVQQDALAALEATRAEGYTAGLVVLATGLGKTWLSAFDSNRPEFARILFVAHREEILGQALRTYRQVRPTARLGHYTGQERDPSADILFASIQTLGKSRHLQRFEKDAFDYIVVDEFHHASARTYRNLIEHFRPKFLLGLTATPERTDGGDLLALCQENVVYRCDLREGLKRALLCPFEYFGVPDEVDYTNIPWRNAGFDEEELTTRLAVDTRAENALKQLDTRGGRRTLAFCVSQRHADFMADYLKRRGKRAVAVHSGESSAPRAQSLEQLSSGHLDVICAVDVFNEGLDLPELDTVLMLRPTESRIVWLQQLGRGLRKTKDDKVLKVIDYIGNHRSFLMKPQALMGLDPGDAAVRRFIMSIPREGARVEIAPGCFVTYDVAAVDILRGLLPAAFAGDSLRRFYEDFQDRHDVRPTAAEAFHEGLSPAAARQSFGSWLAFVKEMKGLPEPQATAFDRHRPWLEELETTPMTKSYKMLVLLAMLNRDAFPGEITIADLSAAVTETASRHPTLAKEIGEAEALPRRGSGGRSRAASPSSGRRSSPPSCRGSGRVACPLPATAPWTTPARSASLLPFRRAAPGHRSPSSRGGGSASPPSSVRCGPSSGTRCR